MQKSIEARGTPGRPATADAHQGCDLASPTLLTRWPQAVARDGDGTTLTGIGIYAARILDVPLPWTSMRAVYRLLGLTRTYGPAAVDTACARALEFDVADVKKIAGMLEQALAKQPAVASARVVGGPARFARGNTEYRVSTTPAGAS